MKKLIILTLIILIAINSFAFNITGVVIANDENKPLEGANIQIIEDGKFTFSNRNGEFAINNIESETATLKISYIGYKTELVSLDFSEDKEMFKRVYLDPSLIRFEAVRVTITKADKRLTSSTLPIVAYDDKQIEKNQPITVADALAANPGISLLSDGIWGKTVSIRGLTKNNIVTLVDGNRISTATNLAAGLSLIDVHDIERIETIKSGASSLYGSGATGGVINVITKKAFYNDEFYLKPALKLGFNSVNSMHYENLSFMTGDQFWNLKLSMQNRKADETQTPKGILKNSQFADQNISANLNLKPFSNHELSFNLQNFTAQNVGIPGGAPLFPEDARVTYLKAYRSLYSVQYQIKNLLPKLTNFSFKLYYQEIFRNVENIPFLVQDKPGPPDKEIHVEKVTPSAAHKTYGFQFQTNWILNENNFVTAGIDGWQKSLISTRKKYLHINVLNAENQPIKTIEQIIGELPLPEATYSTAGIFINDDQFLLDKKLIINIGGRYDLIKIESQEVNNPQYLIVDGVRTNDPPGQVLFWKAEDDLDFSWSANIGLSYKPKDHWATNLNLSRSFRSPTLEERFDYIDLGSLIKLGDPELNSENSFAKDIGIKYTKDTFTFGANLFHNSMKDLVIEKAGIFETRDALIKTNAGQAVLYGYELSGSIFLPYNFSIAGNLAYVRGEDTEIDQPLASIPPLNSQFFINYRLQNIGTISLEIKYFDEQDRVAEWEIPTSGYTCVNLYFHSRKFLFLNTTNQLFLRVDNIADQAYKNHLSTNRGTMQFEPGRNFSVNWQMKL